MRRTLSPQEVRAALRAAACKIAGVMPIEPRPRLKKPTAEACATPSGAVIVEYRPGQDWSGKPLTISPEVEMEARRQSQLEAAILRVCSADTPLKGWVIAKRIGRKHDGYLRLVLSRMVKDGRLRRATVGGYVVEGEDRGQE